MRTWNLTSWPKLVKQNSRNKAYAFLYGSARFHVVPDGKMSVKMKGSDSRRGLPFTICTVRGEGRILLGSNICVLFKSKLTGLSDHHLSGSSPGQAAAMEMLHFKLKLAHCSIKPQPQRVLNAAYPPVQQINGVEACPLCFAVWNDSSERVTYLSDNLLHFS